MKETGLSEDGRCGADKLAERLQMILVALACCSTMDVLGLGLGVPLKGLVEAKYGLNCLDRA